MNRGCVAVGDITCDNCKRLIEAGQRYLVVDGERGKQFHYCVECSIAKGFGGYIKEKGEEVLSFFPPLQEIIIVLPTEDNQIAPKIKAQKPQIIEKPKAKEKVQKPKAPKAKEKIQKPKGKAKDQKPKTKDKKRK